MKYTLSTYLINKLYSLGCTDIFGIPGGVLLPWLEALKNTRLICAHLSYHEQNAGFAAIGFAQSSSKVGCAYATKGPGITNMTTAIADAYCDSMPVVFITAHSQTFFKSDKRYLVNQEIDTKSVFSSITKSIAIIDDMSNAKQLIDKAFNELVTGRPGPIIIDINNKLWNQSLNCEKEDSCDENTKSSSDIQVLAAIKSFSLAINASNKPVILLGDGARSEIFAIRNFSEQHRIPVISSRFSCDLMNDSSNYFGYIGSHGIREANFILSKTDLIIALGNQLNFNTNSQSFCNITKRAKFLHIDIDKSNLDKNIPSYEAFNLDIKWMRYIFSKINIRRPYSNWINLCQDLKSALKQYDSEYPVSIIMRILKVNQNALITSDVGDNAYWLSKAYVKSHSTMRILFSKSYGSLGSSLGKAIGSHYATGKPILCFAGDQGIQLSIQELEYISSHKLPIAIILINNKASGMIKWREKVCGYSELMQVDSESDYHCPNFENIALAYGIKFTRFSENSELDATFEFNEPILIEISVSSNQQLTPFLPIGEACQNLMPHIDNHLYETLDLLNLYSS